MRNFWFALILAVTLTGAQNTRAQTLQSERLFEVVMRTANGKAMHSWEHLDGLLDPAYAETKDFKIVQGRDNHAVKWDDLNAIDLLRAANLLYHLTYAKTQFIEIFRADEVRDLEQITVRMNEMNEFFDLGHFKTAHDDQFNNALSVPSGAAWPEHNIEAWGKEMWFQPPKDLSMKDILNARSGDPLDGEISTAREVFYPSQIQLISEDSVRFLFTPTLSGPGFVEGVDGIGKTFAFIEGAFVVMKKVNRLLIPKFYYLDTAMVPEIIYHEFTHIAFSKYISLKMHTTVVEGLADYGAAVIANSPKLAQKIKEFSSSSGKNGKKAGQYDSQNERLEASTSDFTLGVLWNLRKVVGNDVTNQLVWESRKHMDAYSADLRSVFLRTLLLECSHGIPGEIQERDLLDDHQPVQNFSVTDATAAFAASVGAGEEAVPLCDHPLSDSKKMQFYFDQHHF
jgi:hypothetical protein